MNYNMKIREVIRLLEENGWEFSRQNGSHKIYKKGGQHVSVPDHKGDIPIGTLNSILKTAGLK